MALFFGPESCAGRNCKVKKMGFFSVMVPFVKVTCVFGLILLGIRYKIGLGLSILFGSMLMGLVFGLPLLQWGRTGALALTQEKFLFLITIVALILVLSDALADIPIWSFISRTWPRVLAMLFFGWFSSCVQVS